MTEEQLSEGWQTVKFGEIARNISKRVEPSETDLEIYVGLEHLDPDSLKIKRHGVPSDVEGQKLLVKKGQIIFGKRRAYQRKVGVADWDCICSAHAMVLEAIPGKILPEFLPVFMQSDSFMSRAIAISEGSLSPTIKWKALECQSFLIPLKREQAKVIEKYHKTKECESRVEYLRDSSMNLSNVIFSDFLVSENSSTYSLNDFCKIIRGASPRPKGDPKYYGGSIPRLMTADMNRDGKYVTPCIDFLTEEGSRKSRLMNAGTVVLICSGGVETVGLPSILNIDACIHDGIIALVDVNEEICRSEFLYYLLKYNQRKMNQYATHGGVFVNLTTDIISKMTFGIPSIERQDDILIQLRYFDGLMVTLKEKQESLMALAKCEK